MLTFNVILREYGLDPADVLLVRHSGRHIKSYDAWRTNLPVIIHSGSPTPETFEQYQQTQQEKVFGTKKLSRKYWASFMGARDRTMFIGIYKRIGDASRSPSLGCIHIPLELTDVMAGLRGKVFVTWASEIVWAQFADSNNHAVEEIRRDLNNPFPGWRKFSSSLPELETLPDDWRNALTDLTGIYLLSDPDTKEPRYVGQADGHGGFLGRWEEYARTGHGGNVAMKELPRNDYIVRILEIGSDDELFQKESRWKEILATNALGLNRN